MVFMSWKVSNVEEQRCQFVNEYGLGNTSLAELCRHYGISRPTGYKWLARYHEQGQQGLSDRSRAPHHSPQSLSNGLKELILAMKAKYPSWGARKLVAGLKRQSPHQRWPAPSTVGEFLREQDLTVSRKKRQRSHRGTTDLAPSEEANQVWCVDFKGWFRTGDGARCDPLTLTDNYSRYLLRCQALTGESTVYVKPVLDAAFREYGLPDRIRSDNGAPFGSNGQSGLTALAVWWLKLGILPERIPPGCPQYNGRHERMHRTLKQETAMPPAATLRRQQNRFHRFRHEYNQERPHEALGQEPPALFFGSSPRSYPARLPAMSYPSEWWLRRVSAGGNFWCPGHGLVFVSHALVGEWIGMEPVDEHYWRAWFGRWELGILDQAAGKLYSPYEWKKMQGPASGKETDRLRPPDANGQTEAVRRDLSQQRT